MNTKYTYLNIMLILSFVQIMTPHSNSSSSHCPMLSEVVSCSLWCSRSLDKNVTQVVILLRKNCGQHEDASYNLWWLDSSVNRISPGVTALCFLKFFEPKGFEQWLQQRILIINTLLKLQHKLKFDGEPTPKLVSWWAPSLYLCSPSSMHQVALVQKFNLRRNPTLFACTKTY